MERLDVAFRGGLPAREVDAALRRAIDALQHADRHAVLWFTEIARRRLHRDLGYGSLLTYGTEALGFSRSKAYQFIALAEAFERLSLLRAAVLDGSIEWTKARIVARVATAKTEAVWVRRAKRVSRRRLERDIARARDRTRASAGGPTGTIGRSPAPASLPSGAPALAVVPVAETSADPPSAGTSRRGDVPAIPVTVHLRFEPEAYARFEAMLEALRRRRRRARRESLVLEGLEALVCARTATRGASGPSPYVVVLYRCEACGRSHVKTSAGDRGVDPGALGAILCDSTRVDRSGRRRSSIPPSVRTAVLTRDRHGCRARGCRSTRFLDVHHVVRPEDGGTNDPANLVTLCRSCHRAAHAAATPDRTRGSERASARLPKRARPFGERRPPPGPSRSDPR